MVTTAPIDCHRDPVAGARHLASAFDAGRRLVVWAPDHPDHAHHVAVEFLHPVVAGTVALPARVGRPGDDHHQNVVLAIGDLDRSEGSIELHIPNLADDIIMVSYHLLWELVQLELSSVVQGDGDSTEFLYPFLDGRTDDADDQLRASAAAKVADSREVAAAALDGNRDVLRAAAQAVTEAVDGGGRLLTMGNGGSACDAARAARLLTARGVGAQSLAADYAVITALANDLGPAMVFARQVEAQGRPGDVLIGFSTSGTSQNLLEGFDQAHKIGMVTIGFAGYQGAGFVDHPSIDHTVAVASQSVHRIQEAQAVLLATLVAAVKQLRRHRS